MATITAISGKTLFGTMCLAIGAAACQQAIAQAYPDGKPIRVIVPQAAGGGADVVGRIVGQKISEVLGTSLVFTNDTGAEGAVGTDKIAKASPDGYTIGIATSSHPALPFISASFKLDPLKDFTPICLFARGPIVALVTNAFPAKTAKEFVAQVRANPGKFNYVVHSAQTGLDFGSMMKLGKLDMVPVPYRGSAPAITAMLGNEVQLMATGLQTAVPLIKAGTMRAIAVTSSEVFPGIEFAEQLPRMSDEVPGFKGSSAWFGLIGPPGMPDAVVKKLSAACDTAVQTDAVRARFKDMYLTPARGGVPEIRERIAQDVENTRMQVQLTGLKPQ